MTTYQKQREKPVRAVGETAASPRTMYRAAWKEKCSVFSREGVVVVVVVVVVAL